MDAGNVIIASYVLYAALAWKLYNMPQPYWDFLPMRFFPFVYLFLMLLVALWPVLRFDSRQVTEITPPNMHVLNTTAWFIIICSALFVPHLFKMGGVDGFMQLFTDPSAGAGMYSDALAEAASSGSGVTNLLAICVNAFADITILLLFYQLTLKPRNILLIIGLGLSSLLTILPPILMGQRGAAITTLMTVVVAYFLVSNYLGKRLKKWINMACISFVCLITIPLAAITFSRFDTEDGGALTSAIYYAGQAPLNFNNYGLDAGGIRHGERTLNLVKRLFDPSIPKNFEERRDKYNYLKMDDYIFYTFVGDFTLDFGPYVAPLIFLLFTGLILLLTKPQKNKIEFHQLLLIYLVACICMQGGMYLFAYSDTSGLKMVVLLMLYIILKWSSNKSEKKLK